MTPRRRSIQRVALCLAVAAGAIHAALVLSLH